MSHVITSRFSFALITDVMKRLSNETVGLAASSLDTQSRVLLPSCWRFVDPVLIALVLIAHLFGAMSPFFGHLFA